MNPLPERRKPLRPLRMKRDGGSRRSSRVSRANSRDELVAAAYEAGYSDDDDHVNVLTKSELLALIKQKRATR